MTKPLVHATVFLLAAGCVSNTSRPLQPSEIVADQILSSGDSNADLQLAEDEFKRIPNAWFDLLDSDRVGVVGQEEFLQRFEADLLQQQPVENPSIAFARSSNALGFFTVVDQDSSASLRRDELAKSFDDWFSSWDKDNNNLLTKDEIVAGLNETLPRTNMSGAMGRQSQDPIPGLPTPPPSPVLTPEQSIETIQLVDGFKIELAAGEPMIEEPVALSFDEDGRAYVVEMRTFMLDIDRSNEREPASRISRLVDTDGDGRFDEATVFVDGLILPRAVAAVAGGILYVSDYQLYFALDTDDDGRADQVELVDADYGGGNVEHAPNALFRAMDNWIYNAKSTHRYRLVGNTLVKQETEFRGQWGMTQDNYGRMIYNVNNSQLLGDFAPPNYMGRNPHHPSSAGLNLFVATDQRVFPVRMNTAINRGYSPEVLNLEGKVWVFASSCSPVVYRGDNFPAEFVGDTFVCDPAVNLIKRNIVFDQNLTLSSKFAYDDREFLASTDERFRPSNLYNGPDGALWLVDFYRGIVQYGQFMTDYLRRETLERDLDKGIHCGRIYRIVSTAKEPGGFPRLSQESSNELVDRLSDANGWIRDTAQRLLIERSDRSVVPALTRIVKEGGNPLVRIHALWTLEGLFASIPSGVIPAGSDNANSVRLLTVEPGFVFESPDLPADVLQACLNAIGDKDPKIQVAAIRVTESLTIANAGRQQAFLQKLGEILSAAPDEVLFQAALSAGNLTKPDALPLLVRIATLAADKLLIREAVMSGLEDWELSFLQMLLADPVWSQQQPGRSALLQALAGAIVLESEPTKFGVLRTLTAKTGSESDWRRHALLNDMAAKMKSEAPKTAEARALTASEETLVMEGERLYQQLCAGCHGLNGGGIKPMAPPLANSNWVLGSEDRLIRIVLQGLSGPVTVSGEVYEPPNILPEMPGLRVLDDEQIASTLSYIRRAWDHAAEPVAPAAVSKVRAQTQGQEIPWTQQQLLEQD